MLERLAGVRVPDTLTGVLQARLDGLPPAERQVLQQASVVGVEFWDGVVQSLADAEQVEQTGLLFEHLRALRQRELIARRERSMFNGLGEYTFKHGLLRDVTYESVLLKLRRKYHGRVAAWLEVNSGERINEYLSLIAGHYEKAGEMEKAADFLFRAAEETGGMGLERQSYELLQRAANLLPHDAKAVQRGQVLIELAIYENDFSTVEQAQRHLEEGLALAQQEQDWPRVVIAQIYQAKMAFYQNDYMSARRFAEHALAAARQHNYLPGLADALEWTGILYVWIEGDFAASERYLQECLSINQQLGNLTGVAAGLRFFAVTVCLRQGKNAQAQEYALQAMEVLEKTGDQRGRVDILAALVQIAGELGDFSAAGRYGLDALALAQDLGYASGGVRVLDRLVEVMFLQERFDQAREYASQALAWQQQRGAAQDDILLARVKLGTAFMRCGQLVEARREYEACLGQARFDKTEPLRYLVDVELRSGDFPAARAYLEQAIRVVLSLSENFVTRQRLLPFVALYLGKVGRPVQAAEMLGLVLHFSSMLGAMGRRFYVDPVLECLRLQLSASELDAALTRGAELDANEALRGVLEFLQASASNQ